MIYLFKCQPFRNIANLVSSSIFWLNFRNVQLFSLASLPCLGWRELKIPWAQELLLPGPNPHPNWLRQVMPVPCTWKCRPVCCSEPAGGLERSTQLEVTDKPAVTKLSWPLAFSGNNCQGWTFSRRQVGTELPCHAHCHCSFFSLSQGKPVHLS